MTRHLDMDEYAAYLCGSCRLYQKDLEEAGKREKKLQEEVARLQEKVDDLHERVAPAGNPTCKEYIGKLEGLLREIHEDGYEIEEELEIKIREALGLPLGDEDEA